MMLKRLLLAMALGCWLALPAQTWAQHEAEGAHATEAHTDAPEHAKPSLIPDPTSKETWTQALWTVIIFLVLVAILYPTAWKSVLAGLKKREERIRKDIADAEEARKRAEDTLRKYTQQLADAEDRVREMLTKATAEGEKLATSIRLTAQQEAEEIKERAQKDIEAAKNTAIGEVREAAVNLATYAAEKILRRELKPEDQKDLVRRSLDELQTLNKN